MQYNIKKDLKDIVCDVVNRIHLAQGSVAVSFEHENERNSINGNKYAERTAFSREDSGLYHFEPSKIISKNCGNDFGNNRLERKYFEGFKKRNRDMQKPRHRNQKNRCAEKVQPEVQ